MNKYFSLLIVLVFSVAGYASTTLKGRVGAFLPQNSALRAVYTDIIPCYEVEVSRTFLRPVDLWMNFDFLSKKTHIEDCGSTNLKMYDISFGPKLILSRARLSAYVGVGVNLAHSSLHDSFRENNRTKKWSWGGIFKSGLNFQLTRLLFLDLFFDYLYQPVHFEHCINLGGSRLGLGLGIKI